MDTDTVSPSAAPLRCAIVGMGGFAAFHHEAMLLLEHTAQARLVATCDPHWQQFAPQVGQWRLKERKVAIFDDYTQMLDACADGLDLLIIPTPIPLHAQMHAQAVRRGIPVYLEKPPTLDPRELEAMIDCDRSAVLPTAVGFNLILEPLRQQIKRRLLGGEFGALESVRLIGWRPRAQSYFRRNDWAGRLLCADGRLLLDSCFANALAHYVHNVLFWAGGEGLLHWVYPQSVRAELCRAHAIEGADTFFVEALTPAKTPLRIAMSHACASGDTVAESLSTQLAEITYVVGSHAQIDWYDGRRERHELAQFDMVEHLVATLGDYFDCLRARTSRPATTLADCRPFVHLNGLCYVSAAQIAALPAVPVPLATASHGSGSAAGSAVVSVASGTASGSAVSAAGAAAEAEEAERFYEVPGLRQAVDAFLQQGRWPGYCAARTVEATAEALAMLPAVAQAMLLECRQEAAAVRNGFIR